MQSITRSNVVGPRNPPQHVLAVLNVDHGRQKPPRRLVAAGTKLLKCPGDARGLQARQFHGQRVALGCDIEQPLAAVAGAFLLHHITLVNELLEHAPEGLFGNAQSATFMPG